MGGLLAGLFVYDGRLSLFRLVPAAEANRYSIWRYLCYFAFSIFDRLAGRPSHVGVSYDYA